MRGAAVCFAGLLAGLACGGFVPFECEEDSQCADGSSAGTCQPTGYCSFPDDACESGQRYGDRAATGLAGRCVPPDTAHDTDVPSDGSTGDAPGTSSGPASTSTTTSTSSDPSTSTSTSTTQTSDETTTGEDTDAGTTASPMVFEVSFGERTNADVKNVTRDTFIELYAPGSNFGSHPDMHFHDWDHTSTALLRFDISAIPQSATVLEASLELWTEPAGALDQGKVQGYRLLEAWDDGSVDGEPGVANWNNRLQNVPWTTPGARAGSHANGALFDFSPTANETAYEVSIPVQVVQAWVENPSANHGIAFYGQPGDASGGTAWVSSSEFWNESRRPLLTVTYED